MKKIIVLLLIIFVAACSEDSTPTYTSLAGKWKFAITTVPITGSFEISELSGVLTIDNVFGEFKINGTTYKIDERQAMELGSSGSFSRFRLTAQNNQVTFFDSEYSNDFKTITAKRFYYIEGGSTSTEYDETIVITRY